MLPPFAPNTFKSKRLFHLCGLINIAPCLSIPFPLTSFLSTSYLHSHLSSKEPSTPRESLPFLSDDEHFSQAALRPACNHPEPPSGLLMNLLTNLCPFLEWELHEAEVMPGMQQVLATWMNSHLFPCLFPSTSKLALGDVGSMRGFLYISYHSSHSMPWNDATFYMADPPAGLWATRGSGSCLICP